MILSVVQIDELMRLGGWAALRFKTGGYNVGMKISSYFAVSDPHMAYGYTPLTVGRNVPTSKEIFLMDETGKWLSHVDDDMTRRVVAKRMLWDDDRGKCVHSYDKLARELHTSPYKVRKMHYRGLAMVARRVNLNKTLLDKIKLYLTGE